MWVPGASGPTTRGSLLGNFLLLSAIKQRQGRQRQWRTPSLPFLFLCTPFSWDGAGKWACGIQISRYHVCFLVGRANAVSGILSHIKGSVRSMSCTTHTHAPSICLHYSEDSLSGQCPLLGTEGSTYK